jgi:hypothetical protein
MMRDPLSNKGHSFSYQERIDNQIDGLVPAGDPLSLDIKVEISMLQLRKKSSALERYIYLHTLQDAEETLYYAILLKHTREVLPIVYTPTVGEVCYKS